MVNLGAWQSGRQRHPFGLLPSWLDWGGIKQRQLLNFRLDGCQIDVERFKQFALLFTSIGFAGGCEFLTLEDRQLVGELGVHGLLMDHQLNQLFFGEVFDGGSNVHVW